MVASRGKSCSAINIVSSSTFIPDKHTISPRIKPAVMIVSEKLSGLEGWRQYDGILRLKQSLDDCVGDARITSRR